MNCADAPPKGGRIRESCSDHKTPPENGRARSPSGPKRHAKIRPIASRCGRLGEAALPILALHDLRMRPAKEKRLISGRGDGIL